MTKKNEWKFKDNPEVHCTDGFWYGINNGYIYYNEILEDKKQIAELDKAIELVASFESALEDKGLLDED